MPIYGPSTSFKEVPSELDDADSVYYYFGWDDGSGWLVRRQTRETSQAANAQEAGNPTYMTLAAAWAARASLTYS